MTILIFSTSYFLSFSGWVLFSALLTTIISQSYRDDDEEQEEVEPPVPPNDDRPHFYPDRVHQDQ